MEIGDDFGALRDFIQAAEGLLSRVKPRYKGGAKLYHLGVVVQRFCQVKWKGNLSVGAAGDWLM